MNQVKGDAKEFGAGLLELVLQLLPGIVIVVVVLALLALARMPAGR